MAGREQSSQPAGWEPGREGAATGKVWPEPPEPAAGRKESPGGPHPQQAAPGGQKARALGRTVPVSGDPGMSFGFEGQALSLITRGSGWWLSHGSLCPGACGNWLLFPWLSGVSDCGAPSPSSALLCNTDEEGGEGREGVAFIPTMAHSVCISDCPPCASPVPAESYWNHTEPHVLYSFLSDTSVPFIFTA